MGERGPAKKPAAQRIRDGSFRADRHSDGGLSIEIPPMPHDMDGRAQAFWNVVTSNLLEAGLISRIDGTALRMAADSWSLYLESLESIQEDGLTIESETKYGKVRKANPAVFMQGQFWKQVVFVLKQFGMTPSARTGLNPVVAEDSDNEEKRVSDILGFGGRN